MASQTSIAAKQIRLMEWAEQIQDCQNRPKEMDVAAWCAQHGITKANYYYRLKRVRKASLDLLSNTGAPAFIELPVPRRKSSEAVTFEEALEAIPKELRKQSVLDLLMNQIRAIFREEGKLIASIYFSKRISRSSNIASKNSAVGCSSFSLILSNSFKSSSDKHKINLPLSRKHPFAAASAFSSAPFLDTIIATLLNAFAYRYFSVV